MGEYIQQADVMTRLRSLTALDVAAGTLDGASFIPTAEAVFCEESGLTFESLTTQKQTIAKAAMIAYCAALVVADAPTEKMEGVAGAITPIPAKDKETMHNLLMAEYDRYVKLLTRTTSSWIHSTGTIDYTGRT